MCIKTTIISICIAFLVPLSAVAKQPAEEVCNILITFPDGDTGVVPNKPFEIKVVQSPSYPGQWFNPNVSVQVVVPINNAIMLGPTAYSQIVIQAVNAPGGSSSVTTTFVVPLLPNLETTGVINIFATVSEPVNKGKSIETYCEAVTGFEGAVPVL